MTEKMVQEILKKNQVANPENFDDKVFLVGEWARDMRRDMKMCVITGLARFHEQITGDRFVEELPTVAELRQGKNFPELLLSVQALVLIKVKDEAFVPLLQRDPIAKFDPGFWTLPAGRLDQSSFTLGALTEFLEEIRLICGGKHILPRHFCIDAEEVVRIFRKSWETVSLSHAAPHAAIQEHELLLVELPELLDQRKVQIINNDMLSRADSGLTLLDGLNHTVEMVVPIRLTLPELPIIYDGESFGRKAELIPLTTLLERGWLEEHPATFALKVLLTQHAELLKQLAS
ncbi:MAG TPA: hypothetical protein PLB38_04100 [bacterium]|nr:hypothetical protein [bacterium]